jgi:hypothetical protein
MNVRQHKTSFGSQLPSDLRELFKENEMSRAYSAHEGEEERIQDCWESQMESDN